ncbi:hypothetical protein LASUN_14250 [Lentilactobacillus sunkii]|jgi:uncharacterized protein YxjI|uniref:YxjI n=1 Tax=Lentilactobacillus sunkii TaxID=481719 RepID=A0A1E7XCW4_9LACO|nr:hypothetical protein [Lentilactobacillus sunkii]OFA10871.1 hypothetical protein LASUN_14250 [Lentilactobacillus sunkii]
MSRKLQLNLTELDHTRSSKVTDQYRDTKYLIVGKWGLVSDTFSIYSISGEVVATVRQQSLGMTPKFDLYYLDQFVGSSVIHFTMRYTTIFINGINWLITGNQEKQIYHIIHGRDRIATIKSYSQSDQVIRIMDIDDTNHEPLVLAIAAILNHPSLAHASRLKLGVLNKAPVKPKLQGENIQATHNQ